MSRLDDVIRYAHVSCHMDANMKRAAGIPDDDKLEPEYWEDVRLRLQATYRFATGEPHAVVVIQHED